MSLCVGINVTVLWRPKGFLEKISEQTASWRPKNTYDTSQIKLWKGLYGLAYKTISQFDNSNAQPMVIHRIKRPVIKETVYRAMATVEAVAAGQ